MASVYKRGNKWMASFKGADGLWKALAAGTDKGEAQRMANHWANEAKLRREGLVDLKADGYKTANAIAIGEHVADFAADLKARGSSVKHYTLPESRVRRVMELCGAERLADLSPSRVNLALKRLRDGDETSAGVAKATALHYTRAVKMFTGWLVRDGRARDDVLASLKVGTVEKSERVHPRRALTPAEFDALASTAGKAGESFGMSGTDRAMLYRVAAGTGLRAGELRSLTPESFNLGEGVVSLKAAYSKRRRDDRQPFPSILAGPLAAWIKGKRKGERVFTMPPIYDVSDMFKRDLEAAGIPYSDESGNVVDFHALRHTYITWVVGSGAPVSVCQSLARHSTPMLTFGVYAHVQLADATKAVEALPMGVGSPQTASVALPALKTGTNDAPVSEPRAERALKTDGIFGPRMALQGTTEPGTNARDSMLKIASVDEGITNVHGGIAGGGSRTHTPLRATDFESAASAIPPLRPGAWAL